MGVLHGNPFLIASGTPTEPTFPLQRSLRLRASNSAFFNRTPATATNRRTFTLSGWVKRGVLGTNQAIFSASDGTQNNEFLIYFDTNNALGFQQTVGGSAAGQISCFTNAVFRDSSAWYHVVVAIDTTQTISTSRLLLYINGVAQTFSSYSVGSSINTWVNNTNLHALGKRSDAALYFDGYLTEVNFIDGQALTPLSFGGYNPGTNVWEPRAYTGTYGTNGFYLPFKDNSALENLGYNLANSSPELITNGMFVSNVTGWTVTPGTGGSPSITWQSAHTARLANINAFGATYYQAIPTVVGQTYYAQCYASNISLGGSTRNAQLLKGDNTSFSTNLVVLGSVPQSSGAGAIRNTFVATATTTYIGIQADVGGTSGSADFTQVSVALGGYKNSWNPFGISLTSGVTYDSMLDVPTISGSNNANFCTLNQLRKGTGVTLSEANLTWSITLNNAVAGTIGVSSGKWYWEVTAGTRTYVGIVNESASIQNQLAGINGGYCYAFAGIKYSNGGTSASYGATYTSGDIIGAALDMDAGTITFYKNGVSQGVAFTGLSGIYFPATGSDSISTATGSINFGQRPFAYPIPSGHKMLNTFNLPEPTIPRGDKYFEQYLYTGNGGGQQVGEIQKPMSLFNLDRSLRFRASNSAYLNRTWGTPTDARKFTCSFWLKRGLLSGAYQPFGGGTAAANAGGLQFLSSDALNFYWENATNCNLVTTNVYKDPSLWYNIVVIQDTTQATAGNRLQIYVNGILQTLTGTYPAQNASATFNSATVPFGIMAGRTTSFGLFTDGYLGDFYWIDGQANAATSFGQFDGNNYWTPKAYTGTYGTNGFHLEFEDFSAATAAAIGKDTSGLGNNFTPTGINVTAPANTNVSWDSMVDVPTQTNTDTANFATLNALTNGGGILADGALALNANGATHFNCKATIPFPTSGKYYWETTVNTISSSRIGTGIMSTAAATSGFLWVTAPSVGFYEFGTGTAAFDFGGAQQFTVAVSTGAVVQFAYDVDNSNLYAGINDVWYNVSGATTGSPSTLTNPTARGVDASVGLIPAVSVFSTGAATINFGQRPFRYTPPTGFKDLNSFNVAEVVGDVESPDLVRIKSRSATTPALWFNSVSGAGKYILGNNNFAAEATDVNSLIQFNKNGLLIGNNANINTLGATYIADVWKAGDSTVTNTAGSITSQVRANPISGISVVTYTGNGSLSATVGHGLNVTPKMIIQKGRDSSAYSWRVYTSTITAGNMLLLNSTSQQIAIDANGGISSVGPSTFGFSGGLPAVNANAERYVAYCFSEIAGFSKFDSYISNGSSTDGPFVYTGFRPRWVMIKQRDATRSWIMYDTTRNTYNVVDKYFFMEGLNNNEQTAALLDINSNGFKLKNNNVNTNTTAGQVYIYIAFAEHPFKYALAR